MSAALPILILGGGVGGLAQAALVAASTEATLVGIVEGEEVARARAEGLGHTVFTTLEEAPQDVRAAILALPAAHHAGAAEACAGRGWPMLIDKPIAAALRAGKRVAAAAERAGVPLLVGHHRRHHACVAAAREAARGGILGRLVAAQATWALRPPSRPGGFALRVESGGGPLLAHLIHDVDLLRHLIGETAEVSASPRTRSGAASSTAWPRWRCASTAARWAPRS